MKTINYSNNSQKQAYLNEFKGNLFEFSLAHYISKKYSLESQFLDTCDKNYLVQMKSYESQIRSLDRDLIKILPEFTEKTFDTLKNFLPKKLNSVEVLGKVDEGKSKLDKKETDILLTSFDNQKIPLSLKLGKYGSFVNTKSGGVKSFLSKYFGCLENAHIKQEELNLFIEDKFQTCCEELHNWADLEFRGSFDERWSQKGLPHLPGKLPIEAREILFRYYHEIIKFIYEYFNIMINEDSQKFASCLSRLIGLANEEMIQVMCFHVKDKDEKSFFKDVKVTKANHLIDQLNNFTLLPLQENLASFEIQLNHCILQVRVKPMNSFHQASLKVNCSIKCI